MPVHPRACGEHVAGRAGRQYTYGSSPRLRGTFLRPIRQTQMLRFIPAPAGNILVLAFAFCFAPVHPRACGEHPTTGRRRRRHPGSSPRLRGTSPLQVRQYERPRFIPAPAGNIPWQFFISDLHPVHPRACGEHLISSQASAAAPGSSPRLRGTSFRRAGPQAL